jgi:hypothetical protein
VHLVPILEPHVQGFHPSLNEQPWWHWRWAFVVDAQSSYAFIYLLEIIIWIIHTFRTGVLNKVPHTIKIYVCPVFNILSHTKQVYVWQCLTLHFILWHIKTTSPCCWRPSSYALFNSLEIIIWIIHTFRTGVLNKVPHTIKIYVCPVFNILSHTKQVYVWQCLTLLFILWHIKTTFKDVFD